MIDNFTTKFNDNSMVWRYMNFASFMLVLQRRALYFASVERLREIDPYEGRMPSVVHLDFYENGKQRQALLDTPNAETLNRRMVVNCWHVAEYESAAMWKLYSDDTGIAIQSRVSRLRSAFPGIDVVSVQPVAYVNFRAAYQMQITRFCKRKSFEYEKELRLVIANNSEESAPAEVPDGRPIPVDTDTLIETVYVSPRAPDWVRDMVRCELDHHGLQTKPLRKSNLYDPDVE